MLNENGKAQEGSSDNSGAAEVCGTLASVEFGLINDNMSDQA